MSTAWPEYERVVGHDPLVVYKRVRWADCDPAGVVFTGKFSEYLLLAIGYVFSELAQGDYMQWTRTLGVDTPCKGMDLAFHRALWPEDEFLMTCQIGAIREHSYDIVVEAAATDGTPIFSGRFSPICIRRDARRRTDIPTPLRSALERMQTAPSSAHHGRSTE